MKNLLTGILSLVFLSSAILSFAYGQNKRTITAIRTQQFIRIDGDMNEDAWQSAEVAKEFIQLEPNPGIPATQESEVKVIYDDEAIYVGALLHDNPELISKALFERDNMDGSVETDWFGVAFDTYMDGINGFGFIVSPSGVQTDIKFSADDDDEAWDAVWDSEASITEDGWIVEIKIPYSALRFPDVPQQKWHVQFVRSTFRTQEESFWNEVNPDVDGFFTQAGILEGLENIKSPVRFSATPFLAIYGENYYDRSETPKSSWGRSINGGMDVKFGLSDAFTLDMTLIPDFGQVQSDNEVLNLSPFEVHFDENRQFFTEGTELFNKGGLFYSRRVGGTPMYADDAEDVVKDGETLIENPQQAQLFNATKISGRTPKGTGIGFFNALSGKEYAIIRGENGDERKFLTSPLTNYNVLVFDQNLKNNSYVTLINTNVWRSGGVYDANVTGTEFEIRNKSNTYGIEGGGAISQKLSTGNNDVGHAYNLALGKQSGSLLWELGYRSESDNYDPNDLGFLSNNNEREVFGFAEYNNYEPFGSFLRMGGGVFFRSSWLYRFPGLQEEMYRDNLFTDFGSNLWWWTTTKSYLRYNVSTYFQPSKTYDYFEPRVDGRFLERPAFINLRFNFNTDNRKKFALGLRLRYEISSEKGMDERSFSIRPRFRINDKFSITYLIDIENERNDMGYVTDFDEAEIIIGKRDIIDVTNLLRLNYTFNPKMHLSFRLRQNWTRVKYNTFHNLLINGKLGESNYSENEDINFNAFTIDAVFRWRFAPGSDIFIVWKNSIIGEEERADIGYFDNLGDLFDNPVRNSLSVKFLYYLDYLNLKSSFKKKSDSR